MVGKRGAFMTPDAGLFMLESAVVMPDDGKLVSVTLYFSLITLWDSVPD